MVVLSPSMSSQMRCASANCRPPKPVPSIFSSSPATERSRSTCTGRVGVMRYFDALGFRWVTIKVNQPFKLGRCHGVIRMLEQNSQAQLVLFSVQTQWSLCLRGEYFYNNVHHRDTESTEVAQRLLNQ